MIEIRHTNIGKMTFADRATSLTSKVVVEHLMPLLKTVYSDVEVISINLHNKTLRLLVAGNVVRFSYDVITASRLDDPFGFRLRGEC